MNDAHLTQQAEPPVPQAAPEKPVQRTRLGAHRNGAGWEFLLWAPQVQRVELHLSATGETGRGDRYVLMEQSDGYNRS